MPLRLLSRYGAMRVFSGTIQNYLRKISQPFLDRIDICVEAPRVTYEELTTKKKTESSADIRERIVRTRKIQKNRFLESGMEIYTNSMMGIKETERFCPLDNEGKHILQQAFETMKLTARSYHKILKVARTIADMDESENIHAKHLREAIGYRTLDKKYWGR